MALDLVPLVQGEICDETFSTHVSDMGPGRLRVELKHDSHQRDHN